MYKDITAFLLFRRVRRKEATKIVQSNTSVISRAKSRARDEILREPTQTLFQHSPVGSPLRLGSQASSEGKVSCAEALLSSGAHIQSSTYDDAWFNANLSAQFKAHSTASFLLPRNFGE